jgi:hypothetical protein
MFSVTIGAMLLTLWFPCHKERVRLRLLPAGSRAIWWFHLSLHGKYILFVTYFLDIPWETLSTTTKIRTRENRCVGRVSNRAPSECKAGSLLLQPFCSVRCKNPSCFRVLISLCSISCSEMYQTRLHKVSWYLRICDLRFLRPWKLRFVSSGLRHRVVF